MLPSELYELLVQLAQKLELHDEPYVALQLGHHVAWRFYATEQLLHVLRLKILLTDHQVLYLYVCLKLRCAEPSVLHPKDLRLDIIHITITVATSVHYRANKRG